MTTAEAAAEANIDESIKRKRIRVWLNDTMIATKANADNAEKRRRCRPQKFPAPGKQLRYRYLSSNSGKTGGKADKNENVLAKLAYSNTQTKKRHTCQKNRSKTFQSVGYRTCSFPTPYGYSFLPMVLGMPLNCLYRVIYPPHLGADDLGC